MTSDEINAELKSRGIPFDPESHWKTRESLLKQARELDPPSDEKAPETPLADLVDSANPPVIDTATVDSGEVVATEPPKTLPEIGRVATPSTAEPKGKPSMGDKDPEVIEWRRQNWSAEQFKAKYPNA